MLNLFIYFWLHREAFLGILVPRPGIEPGPSAVRAQSTNHWTAREFHDYFKKIIFNFLRNFQNFPQSGCKILHFHQQCNLYKQYMCYDSITSLPIFVAVYLSCFSHGYWVPLWFFFFLNYLFIYLWLCWVFVSVRGLSLVVASGGHSSSRYAGLSLSRPLLLRSTGSRRACSVIVAYGPSCSAARGIFPDQGSNPCPLHWQADSQPLRHQGSPPLWF